MRLYNEKKFLTPEDSRTMTFKLLPILLLLAFFSEMLIAQSDSKSILSEIAEQKSSRDLMRFHPEKNISLESLRSEHKTTLGLTKEDELKLLSSKTDDYGQTHHRMQQIHQNIPIEGLQFVVHEKNNRVANANGYLLMEMPKRNIVPSIEEPEALELAKDFMPAEIYAWEGIEEQTPDQVGVDYPQAELVWYDATYSDNPSNYELAYKFQLISQEPFGAQQIYVDAHSGEILGSLSMLCNDDTPATGVAEYLGEVEFTCNHQGGLHYLKSTDTGGGIEVCDKNFTEYSSQVWLPITDPDTYFEGHPNGVAVMTGLEWTYDVFDDVFNHQSYDNNNGKIIAEVNVLIEGNPNQAAWAAWNNRIYLGTGDGISMNPLVSLDVIAHELTHGVTQHSSGLIYFNESGALNESFSDIFATYIEFLKHPNSGNWLIGEEFVLQAECLRDMSNPQNPNAKTFQPKSYQGSGWYYGSQDNGGVHFNSGVQNYWFYLLSEGGKNDEFPDITVDGIGMNKAMQIVYLTLTQYLVPTSTYADARNLSIAAASEIFGEGSIEEEQVRLAWCAVGLGTCEEEIVAEEKSIKITYPTGGESFLPGENVLVTYETTGSIQNVMVEYSTSCGVSYTTLFSNIGNTGSFWWTTPGINSTLVSLRITDSSDFAVTDQTDCFSIESISCNLEAKFEVEPASVYCKEEPYQFFVNNPNQDATYQWYVNSMLVSTEIEPSLPFSDIGNNVIQLMVSNDNCSSTHYINLEIESNADANFVYYGNNQSITFVPNNENAGSYSWNIEGQIITQQSPTHFFSSGTHEVCLTITNSCGSQTQCETVIVEDSGTENPCASGNSSQTVTLFSNANQTRTLLKQDEYLWVASSGGLVRWNTMDGSHYKFTTKDGLSDMNILSFATDSVGNIWMGTSDGLNKFDITTETFEYFTDETTSNPNNIPGHLDYLAFDNDGKLWTVDYMMLYHFDGTDYILYDLVNDGILEEPIDYSNEIDALFCDSQNRLWIGTRKGELVIKNAANEFTIIDNQINSSIRDIEEMPNGDILIATNEDGLHMYDGSVVSKIDNYPDSHVNRIFVSPTTTWLSNDADNRMYQYDGTNFILDETELHLAFDLVFNDDNTYWYVQTYQQGVYKFDWDTETHTDTLLTNDLPFLSVGGDLFIGPENLLYIDYYWHGIATFDGNTNLEYNELLDHKVVMMANDGDNNFYVVYQEIEGEFDLRYYDGITLSKLIDLPDPSVVSFRYIKVDKNNSDVYLISQNGSNTEGVWKYDGNNLTQIIDQEFGQIDDMLVDPTGNLWIADRDNYLYKYNETDGLLPLLTETGDSIKHVSCLASDPNSTIWFSAGTDLFEYDGVTVTEHSYAYQLLNGTVPWEVITDLLVHSDGSVWFSTYRGWVVHYEQELTGDVTYFKEEDDISGGQQNLIEDANGNVWVASSALHKIDLAGGVAQADFEGPSMNICRGDIFEFINNSQNATSYEWLINDAFVSDETNLNYVFQTVGLHTVTLIAYDDNNCSNSKTISINVTESASDFYGNALIQNCDLASITLLPPIDNMVSYEWTLNGQFISNEQMLSIDSSGLYILTVIDECDNVGSKIYEIVLQDNCNNLGVYPGDFNNDGIVNQYDVLFFGLSHGLTGPSRLDATTDWVEQPAADWAQTQLNGENAALADANGDGICDLADGAVIQQNYLMEHEIETPEIVAGAPVFTIKPSVLPSYEVQGENGDSTTVIYIELELLLADNFTEANFPAYGFAGSIQLNIENAESSKHFLGIKEFDLMNSCLGDINVEMFSTFHFDTINNVIHFAVTRLDHQNVYCQDSTKIGALAVVIDDHLPLVGQGEETFSMQITEGASVAYGAGIDALGGFFNPIIPLQDSEIIQAVLPPVPQDALGIEEINIQELALYPNPTTDFVIIETGVLNTNKLTIEIVDLSGKTVYTQVEDNLTVNENNSIRISTQLLDNGIYILRTQKAYSTHSINKLVKTN